MKKLSFILSLVFFLLIGLGARAQQTYTISGTVSDGKGETLPGATVFLTNTKHNAVTNIDGKFAIYDVEPGTYEVVIKMLGFVPYVSKVAAGNNAGPINVVLKQDVKLLKEVTIKSTDPNRVKYLQQFIKYFIGESNNASQCKILNPEVLNFHYDKNTGVLQASAGKILVIQNDGLGYQLNYLLTGFKFDTKNLLFSYTGYPYFEELKGSAAQQNRWEKNRREAYSGSMNHFFRAIYNHTATADGFMVYPLSDKSSRESLVAMAPLSADSLFIPVDKNLKLLKADYTRRNADDTSALYVFYRGAKTPYDFVTSGMELPPPVKLPSQGQLSKLEPVANRIMIDKNGELTPQQSFLVSGYWAWGKIAEQMPLDYHIESAAQPINSAAPIADNDTKFDEIEKRFTVHAAYHPTEKIYLQLNKPWYNRADTIWFKAYIVTGDHKPTDISEAAYVLLTDNRDSVIQQVSLKLHSGTAFGELALPISTMPGTYHVKAYTNWMRNGDGQYFYDRQINIGGLPPTAALTTPSPLAASKTNPQPDVQFFPEGGILVNGLHSRVAFKAVNPGGSAANVKGNITDADGVVITAIQSGHDGMGIFDLTPQAGKVYHAVLQQGNGQPQNIQLPATAAEGFGLAVNNTDTKIISVNITANQQLLKNKTGQGFYLVAQMAGKIVYTAIGTLSGPVFNYHISKEKIPSGIIAFTLFADTGEPLLERIAFLQQPDTLAMAVHAEKIVYAPNEKINLSIQTRTPTGKPALGNFSVAVVNESLAPADEATEPTIFSQLLLSSELHGAIADPTYYFRKKDEKTVNDLDMLMLIQGYRKLEWKQLLDTVNKKPEFLAERGLTISGTVKTLDGKPVIRGKVSLLTLKQHIAADTVTDSNGRFAFTGIDISDTTSVLLKAAKGVNDNYVNIFLDHPEIKTMYTPAAVSPYMPPVIAEAMQKAYLQEEQQYPLKGQLKEVTIKDKKYTGSQLAPWVPVLTHSANLNGAGRANQVILGTALGDCINLSDCLSARLVGVNVYGDGQIIYKARGKKEFYYSPKGPRKDIGEGHPDSPPYDAGQSMSVYVDGGEISPDMINYINTDEIYSIEVLTSVAYTSMYGFDGSSGIILITTKHPADNINLKNIKRPPGIINYVFDGYYKARTFYTPKYTNTNTTVQDQRSAIYWKPDIITGKDGNAYLEYSNAGKGTYRVVVEGIDNDGNIGRFVYRYKVE